MDRRQFSLGSAAAVLSSTLPGRNALADNPSQPFTLNYAPHFGMFTHSAGEDLLDQLRFAADQGFRAWEDNPMKDRSAEQQTAIAKEMERLGIQMGVISALKGVWKAVNFAGDDQDVRAQILKTMRGIVDVARRVNATYLTIVPGLADPKLPHEYQMANCIDLLQRCCDVVEPHGLVMVLEPLNRKTNHPGVLLHRSPQAYLICKAVARPSCKILFDIYHQQITEGNLIPNIDRCWDEIAYFQCGDNPGRREPGTGEINYRNVFAFLHRRGFGGVVGMEHKNAGQGLAGEMAVIQAYRSIDPAPNVSR
ncbi:Hydroxypyruvate isomerase [Stieleria maiorica]|uniref:Hydroxypyruvate isomerase n=1 Tax=Stieleria maiorica TaxID=2795974 RepID=A0A5B9MFB6_9BACT|nr:TIM barrel protein [Stieleria maiorica]QEF98255.1 Hydroxypyruvate isomerase [Stieleria maiorica]